MSLKDVIHRTLSGVRLATSTQPRERVRVVTLLDEIAATGVLHSQYRNISFTAIRAHAGDIHVRNIPGKGCVFVIEMPLAGAPQHQEHL